MATATEKRVTELLIENAQLRARLRADTENMQRELADSKRRIQGEERDRKTLEEQSREASREVGKWQALAEERETVILELKDTRNALTDRLMGASAHVKGLEQENRQLKRQMGLLQSGRIVDIIPPETPAGDIEEILSSTQEENGEVEIAQNESAINNGIEMTENEIVLELFEIWATVERAAHRRSALGLARLTILQRKLIDLLRGLEDPKWKTEAARLLNRMHRVVAEQQSLPLDTK